MPSCFCPHKLPTYNPEGNNYTFLALYEAAIDEALNSDAAFTLVTIINPLVADCIVLI